MHVPLISFYFLLVLRAYNISFGLSKRLTQARDRMLCACDTLLACLHVTYSTPFHIEFQFAIKFFFIIFLFYFILSGLSVRRRGGGGVRRLRGGQPDAVRGRRPRVGHLLPQL